MLPEFLHFLLLQLLEEFIMLQALLAAAPGIFAAGKGIWDSVHKSKNPSDAANNTLQQTPGMVKPYYDPYINAGKDSLDTLIKQYNDLTNNPGGKYDELGAGYKQSPGYANTLREALAGSDAAAARGGTLGTPMHGQNNATVAGDVANKDFEAYLNHVMSLYGQGLSGNADINKNGQSASESFGNIVGSVNNQVAQNQYTGQQDRNTQQSANWNNIAQGAGNAVSGYNQNQDLMAWAKAHGYTGN